MAIYEYECMVCCYKFEILTSKPMDKKEKCPRCSGHVKKLISSSTFFLKGGGWEQDGYSNKKREG